MLQQSLIWAYPDGAVYGYLDWLLLCSPPPPTVEHKAPHSGERALHQPSLRLSSRSAR